MSQSQRIYMTPGCAARMRAELKDLLYVKRPEMVNTVAWAASNGDRSENADYHYGKKRLRQIDGRLRFLQKRMESAEIVDPVKQQEIAGDKVLFGCTVTVENEDGDYTVDPDGDGPAESFTVYNRDFNRVSLRGTGVLRWEWRPGSTLFLVWQQNRSSSNGYGDFDLARDADQLFAGDAHNVFMVKATYWIG